MEYWRFAIPVIVAILLCLALLWLNRDIKRSLWVYKKTGNKYLPVAIYKMKNPTTGEWVDAVAYRRDGNIYIRERQDFYDKFVPISQWTQK